MEKLKISDLQPNVPAQIAVRDLPGKFVPAKYAPEGQEVLYRLVDGRHFYAPLDVAQKINMLGVGPMEPFHICLRWNKNQPKRIDLWKSGEAEKAAAGVGAPTTALATSQQPSSCTGNGIKNGNGNGHGALPPAAGQQQPPLPWATHLLNVTNALSDVYASALAYASHHHGNQVKPEDVRALVTTAYISLTQHGGPNVA